MSSVGTNDNLFAEAIGSSVPVPIHESLIHYISNFVQPVLNVHALGYTSLCVLRIIYGNKNTGEFLFN